MPIPSSARPIIIATTAWLAVAASPRAATAQAPAEREPGGINGVVIVAESGAPLAAAAVTIRGAADSAVVTGVMTTEDGQFRVEGLPLGEYRVHVSHLGFASQTVPDLELTSAESVADVGVLALEADAVVLDEIEARAQRSPVRLEIDRTVYSAEDLPSSAGGTMQDLLRDIPELEVDVDGTVKLRGQAVAIHLNGRPAPLRGDALVSFLRQMGADRIATVEVMPNPSARYDPEGMGGIVNLVLDQNVGLGLSGNVSLTGSTRGRNGVGANLAYQRGRLTVFGSGGLYYENRLRGLADTRENLRTDPVTLLDQRGEQTYDQTTPFIDLTTELKVGARTTAWLSSIVYGGANEIGTSMLYDLSDGSGGVLNRYGRFTSTDYDYTGYDVAVGLKHAIVPERHEFNVDLRYNGRDQGTDVSVDQRSRLDPSNPLEETLLTDRDVGTGELTVHADYMRPWGANGRLEFGLEAKRRSFDDEYIQTLFPGGVGDAAWEVANVYAYDESYQTLYVIVSRAFGKFGIQLGARGELAETDLALRTPDRDEFKDDYRTVFPTLNLSWDAGAGRTVGLSYSKRVARPIAEFLNPRAPNHDPLNLFVGNPSLGPSFVHSVDLELGKVGEAGMLRLSPYYRRTVDSWDEIKRVDSLGVSTVSYENSASSERLGASAVASFRAGRWSGSANVDLARSVVNASNVFRDFENTSLEWTASVNGSARVTDALSAQLSANYFPARTLPQGRQSASFLSSVALRQELMNGKATLSLRAEDPFDLAEFTFETRGAGHLQSSRTENKLQALSLTFGYRFGRPPEPFDRRREDEAAAGASGERLR